MSEVDFDELWDKLLVAADRFPEGFSYGDLSWVVLMKCSECRHDSVIESLIDLGIVRNEFINFRDRWFVNIKRKYRNPIRLSYRVDS